MNSIKAKSRQASNDNTITTIQTYTYFLFPSISDFATDKDLSSAEKKEVNQVSSDRGFANAEKN